MPKERVVIPTNPSELLQLAQAIKQKHDALGDASPLKSLDWAANGTVIAQATEFDGQATQLRRDAEKATASRDNLVENVNELVRQCRDILLGIYRSNPRTLGDFGFDVTDTPQTTVKKPVAAAAAASVS